LILPFIRRHWWLTQQRLFSTLGFATVLPIILHFLIITPLANLVAIPFENISYEKWAFSGILVLIGIISLVPVIYRDLFDFLIHKKAIIFMTLAPISKLKLITGILLGAILESLVFEVIGLIVLFFVSGIFFNWEDYLIMFGLLMIINTLSGSFIITLALLTKRVFSFFLILIIFFSYVLFGSGMIIPFDYFPDQLGVLLRYLPLSVLIHELQLILFTGVFHWIPLSILLFIIFPWTYVNSEIFRRKLNQ